MAHIVCGKACPWWNSHGTSSAGQQRYANSGGQHCEYYGFPPRRGLIGDRLLWLWPRGCRWLRLQGTGSQQAKTVRLTLSGSTTFCGLLHHGHRALTILLRVLWALCLMKRCTWAIAD